MKIYQNGKELKNATVSYFVGGQPAHVTLDGVNYDPAAFEFSDEETVSKRTKPAPKTKKRSEVLSTEDLKKK